MSLLIQQVQKYILNADKTRRIKKQGESDKNEEEKNKKIDEVKTEARN